MSLRVVFIDEVAEAFENALARGEFDRDPTSRRFIGRYTYLYSDADDGVIVADSFQGLSNNFVTIARKDSP